MSRYNTLLKLEDFFHLPQVDTLVEQLAADGPGLVVVAGLDPRPMSAPVPSGSFLPSGRAAIFRILLHAILAADPSVRSIIVAEDQAIARAFRARHLRRRIELALVQAPYTYADQVAEAVRRRPGLLVIDRLCAETAPLALAAAQEGLLVLSQLDTVFWGTGVARHLLDLGVPPGRLAGLAWVVAVQRLPTLCPQCRQPAPPDPAHLIRLRQRYPNLDDLIRPESADRESRTFYRADGCPHCHYTGRYGDVAVFDIFRGSAGMPGLLEQPSLLPMSEYVLHLALLGHLSLEDALQFETDQFHRTYNLLTASERALVQANVALGRKLAELEAANQVLQQRTRELFSLQELGQTLITSADLEVLAARVCHRAGELCGADRAILYLLRATGQAAVLAVRGWDPGRVPRQLDAALVFDPDAGPESAPFDRWPPGVSPRPPDVEGAELRAGLYVPLVAQGQTVGLLIVHATQRSHFAPGEVALLQTFANQAALAIQRAGLVSQLRAKIAELETAQVELAEKERMERELELARQVQQSVLPRTFPPVPGYQFAARYEPARQVGGDFYDVIRLDAGHFGVAIADVSDKGMPAALYMALTRSLLRAEARRGRAPRAVLMNVNGLLLELGEPNMFVTMFYGVVERATGRLTYARAGHDRPLLLRGETIQALGGDGTALGLLDQEDLGLSEEQITLVPGDRLVLYTDGLTDVLAPDDQLFDLAQLRAVLRAHAGLPPAGLCTAVFADLAAYRGNAEQYDDMAMLVVGVE